MTVSITNNLPVNTESSKNSLNANDHMTEVGDKMAFSALIADSTTQNNLDNKAYLMSDGQLLTTEQLLEMMKGGNNLPVSTIPVMPNLSELQHYKLQSQVSNKTVPLSLSATAMMNNSDTTSKFNQNINLALQNSLQQHLTQSSLLNQGQTQALQFSDHLNSLNLNTKMLVEPTMVGFSAASGYHVTLGQDGMTGYTNSAMSIPTHIQNPQWNQSFAQSVQYLMANNIHHAEIKLNPPDLGMLDIRVVVNDNQATVNFTAANAAVRDAIESALPRLRDMLAENGISLNDANVSEHSLNHEQDQNQSETNDSARDSLMTSSTSNQTDAVNNKLIKIGLVDTYA